MHAAVLQFYHNQKQRNYGMFAFGILYQVATLQHSAVPSHNSGMFASGILYQVAQLQYSAVPQFCGSAVPFRNSGMFASGILYQVAALQHSAVSFPQLWHERLRRTIPGCFDSRIRRFWQIELPQDPTPPFPSPNHLRCNRIPNRVFLWLSMGRRAADLPLWA